MEAKSVIITGSGGIGSAIAEKFSAEGFRVFVLSRSEAESPGELLLTDVTQEAQVIEAFRRIVEKTPVSAVIHTAISEPVVKKISDMTRDEFATSFEVDVFGGFTVFKTAAEMFSQQGSGCIIGLGSLYAETGSVHPALAGYIAAKMALRGLLRQLQEEYSPKGVRVNMVSPGFVHVGLNAEVPASVVEFMKDKQPQGYVVTKEQVAEVVFSSVIGTESGKYIPVVRAESEAL